MAISPEDQLFLDGYNPANYDRPSLAIDVVVATVLSGTLQVLVVQRTEAPQKGLWALPGGFVRVTESLDEAVQRVLSEKAGLHDIYVEQLYTFGAVDRDPRTRVITVTYLALVGPGLLDAIQSPTTRLAAVIVPWPGEEGGDVAIELDGEPSPLAFDHAGVIGAAVLRLRGKLNYAPVGYELLAPQFTLRELQVIHESILGLKVNKDSFRRKILARAQVLPTGHLETNVSWRPAELYRFKARRRA